MGTKKALAFAFAQPKLRNEIARQRNPNYQSGVHLA
jgi:hypothetical protein